MGILPDLRLSLPYPCPMAGGLLGGVLVDHLVGEAIGPADVDVLPASTRVRP
jgi:hypothetical protein